MNPQGIQTSSDANEPMNHLGLPAAEAVGQGSRKETRVAIEDVIKAQDTAESVVQAQVSEAENTIITLRELVEESKKSCQTYAQELERQKQKVAELEVRQDIHTHTIGLSKRLLAQNEEEIFNLNTMLQGCRAQLAVAQQAGYTQQLELEASQRAGFNKQLELDDLKEKLEYIKGELRMVLGIYDAFEF